MQRRIINRNPDRLYHIYSNTWITASFVNVQLFLITSPLTFSSKTVLNNCMQFMLVDTHSKHI
jgi:hypothetical protein